MLDTSTNPVSVNLRRSQFTEWTTSEINDDIDNPVAITFSTTLPDTVIYDELVRHAVLLYCASMFRDRDNSYLNASSVYNPIAAERLLAPLKRIIV